MTSKVAEAVERVKDAVLPAPTYKTKTVKFKDLAIFTKSLMRGDTVVAGDGASAVGLIEGAEHEIEKVEGEAVVLKGGKKLLVEFLRPEVRRRERVRRKIDGVQQRALLLTFAKQRWDSFKANLDAMIKGAKDDVAKAERALEAAQNNLIQLRENVVRLEAAKTSEEVWPATLVQRLAALIENKLFTNFELVHEGDHDVFVAYTGPIEYGINGEKKRGEFAIKLLPPTATTRIIVENVTPGALASDVPVNEGRTGVCNICFGHSDGDVRAAINDENWIRVLTFVRTFLEGNRTRN